MKAMKTAMKAIVCYAPKDYRFVTKFPRPAAGLKQMVIKVAACGICGGDCKCWLGAKMFWGGNVNPSTGNPQEPWIKPPVIPGHEFYGHIEEMGEGAKEHFISSDDEQFELGDRVIAEHIIPCNRLYFCRM